MITKRRRLSGAVALGLSVALTGAFATPAFAHGHLPDGEPTVVNEGVTTVELPTGVHGSPNETGAQLVRYDDGTTVLKFTDADSQNPHEVIVDLGDNDALDNSDTVEAEYVTVDEGKYNPVTVYQLTATDRSSKGKNGVAIGDAVISTFHTFYEFDRTIDTVNFFDDEKVLDIWLYEDGHEVIEFDSEGYVRSTKTVHTDEGTRVTEYVGDTPYIPHRTKSTFIAAKTGNVTITEYGQDGLIITKRTTIGGKTGDATVTEYDTHGTTVTEYDGAVAEENLIRTTSTESDEDAKTTTRTRTDYTANTQAIDVYKSLFDGDVPKHALPGTRTITDFGPDGILGGEDDIVSKYVQEGGQLVLVDEEDSIPSPKPTEDPTDTPTIPEKEDGPNTPAKPETPVEPTEPKDTQKPKPIVFKDNPAKSGFYAPIQWMAAEGISVGYADGTFNKNKNVTRGETAQFMYKMAGSTPTATGNPFVDVRAAFKNAIGWFSHEEISVGYADGTFRPGQAVTRAEFAAFLYRLEDPSGYKAPSKSQFSDINVDGANWKAISWLSQSGITSGYGDGSFKPSKNITRAETAAFLNRYATIRN